MKLFKFSKDTWLYLYYILLLLVYLSWNNPDTVPGASLRFAYLGAALAPVFVFRKYWLPAVILLFSSLAKNGYSSSYLPVMFYTYLGATIVGLFFYRGERRENVKIPNSLFIIFIATLMINIIIDGSFEEVSVTSLTVYLLMFTCSAKDDSQISLLKMAIIAVSFTLTLSYFLYGKNHAELYAGFGEERVGFADINYVASLIGFGVLLLIMELMSNKNTPFFVKILYAVMIIMSSMAMFMNASRGSLLALGVGVSVLIIVSKLSVWYKGFFIALIVGFLIYLFNSGVMDLLIYRIQSDTSTGGTGRVDIWVEKLNAYLQTEDFYNMILGYGYHGGRSLANGSAFHNDFIAFLVEYGIVGFITFVSFFFYPLRYLNIKSSGYSNVLACMAYMIMVSTNLEPFAAGRIPFYSFWLYTCLMAQYNHKKMTHSVL